MSSAWRRPTRRRSRNARTGFVRTWKRFEGVAKRASRSERLELRGADAAIGKQHRNAVVDDVDDFCIAGDQRLRNGLVDRAAVDEQQFAATDHVVELFDAPLFERSQRFVADRAAQDVEQGFGYRHGRNSNVPAAGSATIDRLVTDKVCAHAGQSTGRHRHGVQKRQADEVLDELEIPYETEVVSAHRTPEKMLDYARSARSRGLALIVAGAGGAAHLPGMLAAATELPVLGVPVKSRALNGLDSLLSIVQMPRGVPVATLAIGDSGAANAGLLAASILGISYPDLAERYRAWRARQTEQVLAEPDPRENPRQA